MTDLTLPKEQLTAYQRWEMASFNEEPTSTQRKQAQAQAAENEKTVATILNQVRQEAFKEGFQHGYQDGLSNAEQVLGDARQQLLQLAGGFRQALLEADTRVAESVLTLSLELAKAMLKTKLQADPLSVIPVVLDALHYLPQVKAPARVIVHHEDAQLLRAHLADELREQGWQVVEDSSIERGGCLIETAENQIDATNAMRWKRITQGLSRFDDWHTPSLFGENQ